MKPYHVAIAAITLSALAGCGGGTDPQSGDALAKLIKVGVETSCTISPSLIDIGAALAAAPGGVVAVLATGPVTAIAKGWVTEICDQWKTKHAVASAVDDGCLATVNGVCIRKGD